MNPPGERFTLDGSDALEGQLQRTCAKVRYAVQRLVGPQRLEGLLLGGGYGRGEGGVLRAGTLIEERPYNDLEFYVLARGSALFVRPPHASAAARQRIGRRRLPPAKSE